MKQQKTKQPQPKAKEEDPEIAELRKKIEDLENQFNEELEKLEKAMNMIPKDMREWLDNPEDLTEEEQEAKEKEEKKFYEKMEQIMGKEMFKEIKSKGGKEEKGKKIKQRTRAGRRKWIEMK